MCVNDEQEVRHALAKEGCTKASIHSVDKTHCGMPFLRPIGVIDRQQAIGEQIVMMPCATH